MRFVARPPPWVLTLALGVCWVQVVCASPAPRSDVDWGDSAENWLDMVVSVDPGGELVPHITVSRQRLGEGLWFIATTHWTGDEWVSNVVRDDLLVSPLAVTTLREDPISGDAELVYVYHDIPQLIWESRDLTSGLPVVMPRVFGPALGRRASVSTKANEDPAIAWFTQPAGQPINTYFARWDMALDVKANERELTRCGGGFPSLVIDAQDRFQVSCIEEVGAAHNDIIYVLEDGAAVNGQVSEIVFGAADAHQWLMPDMTLLHDQPGVVAFDNTTREVVFRRRVATGWLPPVVIAAGLDVRHLSIAGAEGSAGEGTFAIAILTPEGVRYVEYAATGGGGSLGPMRRADLNPESGAACEPAKQPVDVHITGDRALLGWFAETKDHFDQHLSVDAARFAQFRRQDASNWSELPRLANTTTSIALTESGDAWTCYFDESALNPPQIDLMLKVNDLPAVTIATDTGLPPDLEARGCDVATTSGGLRVGVLWADSTAGELRYRGPAGLGLGPAETLADGFGPVDATGHLALAYDANGRAHAVFRRMTLEHNPWHGVREPGGWQLEQIDTFEGGEYPDVTVRDGTDRPLVSYTLVENNGMVTHARRNAANTFWTFVDLVTNALCLDTSIAARFVDGEEQVAVAWRNVSTGRLEFADPDDQVVDILEDAPGVSKYVAIGIDVRGEVAATYHQRVPGKAPVLRWSAVRTFSGGRADLATPPVPKRVKCDLRSLEWGTDFAFDRFDNPRVMYRRLVTLLQTPFYVLHFLTRP